MVSQSVDDDGNRGVSTGGGVMHARFRNTNNVPPGDDARRDGTASGTHELPAALHGPFLNVSPMATIDEMAAGVAHELNQPLTAIANYAQACDRLLARPGSDLSDLREALRQITVQTTRALNIIRRLRALARSQQGEHVPASVNALVTEMRELVQTDARVHGVELSLELASNLPEVVVDVGQISK